MNPIEKALKEIPSTHIPIFKLNGKKYHCMCKKELAQKIQERLLTKKEIAYTLMNEDDSRDAGIDYDRIAQALLKAQEDKWIKSYPTR